MEADATCALGAPGHQSCCYLRPARLAGSSPAAKWPFCRVGEKIIKKMKVRVL